MRETNGATLGTQLHMRAGEAVVKASAVKPITNDRFHKPRGGLWTSTYLGQENLSGWHQWGESEGMTSRSNAQWLLTPETDARLLVVDTFADLMALVERYSAVKTGYEAVYTLDFVAMAQDGYAGLNLTDEGQWATRHTDPNLNGWDCESTVWFRWAFESVERVENIAKVA